MLQLDGALLDFFFQRAIGAFELLSGMGQLFGAILHRGEHVVKRCNHRLDFLAATHALGPHTEVAFRLHFFGHGTELRNRLGNGGLQKARC